MPDPITPTTPAEIATPQTPEPTTPPTGTVPEQPQETEVPVTRGELERRLAQIKSEVRQADKQRAQAIKQELNTLKKAIEAGGTQVTPQIEEALTQTIEQRLDAGQEPLPTGSTPPADDYPEHIQTAAAMMADANTIVRSEDPEFKQFMEPHLNNPPAFLRATVKAIEAKQARTLQAQQQASLRTPASGGGTPPGEPPAQSSQDYYKRIQWKT